MKTVIGTIEINTVKAIQGHDEIKPAAGARGPLLHCEIYLTDEDQPIAARVNGAIVPASAIAAFNWA